jgi:hypothetical protein
MRACTPRLAAAQRSSGGRHRKCAQQAVQCATGHACSAAAAAGLDAPACKQAWRADPLTRAPDRGDGGAGAGAEEAWWARDDDEDAALVDAPRRAERLDIMYARASKQARRPDEALPYGVGHARAPPSASAGAAGGRRDCGRMHGAALRAAPPLLPAARQRGLSWAARAQVDVRALKEALWRGALAEAAAARAGAPGVPLGPLSFQAVLGRALGPGGGGAGRAGAAGDLSVHLCFICALHLANEHGLRITGAPGLDRLDISGLPAAG